ncbi:hypothetical protein AQUCO_04100060v1 [Aquilegia coerulea]|uniref:Protein kinase domain-containing protein n=1 Tax=Aquilegia coerulea TaxID=218851 RepID=A0A2G5CQ10_AQUCA|nr:hypothetical protein AQUCO_04100060v1 [Aquilegia coerulea]
MPKLFLPLNFSMSNFKDDTLPFLLEDGSDITNHFHTLNNHQSKVSKSEIHTGMSPNTFLTTKPCSPIFTYGKLGNVSFPYSSTTNNPECGLAVMDCTGPQEKVQFHKEGKWYYIDYFNYGAYTIVLHDQDLQKDLESSRCDSLNNFPQYVFPFFHLNLSKTKTRPFFKCKHEPNSISPSKLLKDPELSNYTSCKNYDLYFYHDHERSLPSLPQNLSHRCSPVRLPYQQDNFGRIDNLTYLWYAYFNITWEVNQSCWYCFRKGGQCRTNPNEEFECGNLKEGLFVGIGGVLASILVFCCQRFLKANSILFWKRKKKAHGMVEDFLKNYGSLAPKRYSYSDIKNITCSFKDKIGQGGYGGVYKGKLLDGRLVAVKLLDKAKGDGEEFINEVASISKTSHVNVVSLLGFCFDGSKRALVYEFMVNGSLEKFIYGHNTLEAPSPLGYEKLYEIAIGVARGLEYLHRGCNTPILHFDIKPHNIILDKDFTPKISDFGLAKLCSREESIISILGARGTVGYIAPEVFSRNFGVVSHKSDVYSYGMMVLEIVGKRKNVDDVTVDHTSSIYFPQWIYKRLELNQDLGLPGIISNVEEDITRKLILVALWCIQTNPVDRPGMSRVVEMLEARQEILPIPPKPYLCSPPRSTVHSSNT